jgi:hypothetical protein
MSVTLSFHAWPEVTDEYLGGCQILTNTPSHETFTCVNGRHLKHVHHPDIPAGHFYAAASTRRLLGIEKSPEATVTGSFGALRPVPGIYSAELGVSPYTTPSQSSSSRQQLLTRKGRIVVMDEDDLNEYIPPYLEGH